MRDVSSLFRLVSSESASVNYTPVIAAEGRSIYDAVAQVVCRPGTPKKTMDDLVARALKGYALWRVRACRLGEAGAFSAAAIRDLQSRYSEFTATEGKRLAHERAVEAAKRRPVAEPDYVKVGRAEYETLLTRIAALEAALR